MNPMTIIGLTGPSGAGKSTIAALFTERGIPVMDADRIYHALLVPPSPCLDAIREAFSDAILHPDGTLNRKALSALVFEDSDAGRERLSKLNAITHRFVIQKTDEALACYRAQGLSCAVIDAPLLIEAGMHRGCDLTVCVLAPADVRIRRLMQRDGRSEAELHARIQAQPDDAFYRAHADVIVINDGTATMEQLRARVNEILPHQEDPQ
jgi:dephospho-CoA kinase